MRRVLLTFFFVALFSILALATDPVVAVHFSELTQALETTVARPPTPTGTGTTGYEWWTPWWHYFVMPESLKEALRADGTPFAVVSDADISAGRLISPDGTPRYPIVVSLASEAIRDDEIGQFQAYVAAGGFLFVGSSSFTRNPDGTSRGNFALAAEMGLSSASADLANWRLSQTFIKQSDHRLVSHIPTGSLSWRLPRTSEDIPLGISPNHAQPTGHYIWRVSANGAAVIAASTDSPYLATQPYGQGMFIYHAGMQPLIGNGGEAPGMYAYGIFRNAIEWAFEAAGLPVVKVSPWPYQHNAAYVIRHDFENLAWEISHIATSAQAEHSLGGKGDYYFCTGWLRDQMGDSPAIVEDLRTAVSMYGATVGPHNGGLRNPNNPSLTIDQYDYWHWGPDEALDALPPGYPSGGDYARSSIALAFADIDRWLTGLNTNTRTWASPYFNSARDGSNQILEQLGVVAAGEQKLGPFPHGTVSAQTSGQRFNFVSLPVSDWYINSIVAQSIESGHDVASVRALVDYYYNLGALVNLYSHHSSHAGLPYEYLSYCAAKPAIWSTNAAGVAAWWAKRSPVQITSSCSASSNTLVTTVEVTGATDPDTAIEFSIPNWAAVSSSLTITLDGLPAGQDSYRTYRNGIKVRVGTSVSVVQVSYVYDGVFALNDHYSVLQDDTLQVAAPGVLGNDIPGGTPGLTAGLVTSTSEGTLVFLPNGSFEYTPRAGFTGADTFTYQAVFEGVSSNAATVTITATQLAVGSVALNPARVMGGLSSQGTVTLNGAAPAGGAVVGLTSSVPAAAQAPASVTVAAGATTATFPVTTSPVATNTPVTITATYGGGAQSAQLTVTALGGEVLFSDDFSGPSGSDPLWTTVLGSWNVNGGAMNGTSAANNIGCAVVDRNWTDYRVRGRFMFPAGTFAGGLGGRLNRATGARYGAWIYPTAFGSPTLVIIKFRSWTAWGGIFMARVTLPSLGTTWHTLMMTFQGNRIQVSYDNNQLIDITDNGFDSRAAYLSGGISMDLAEGGSPRILSFDDILVAALGPGAALSAVSVNPATAVGGAPVTGTVTLDTAAPTGGAVVGLTSSMPSAAQVPANVTVAAGATTATFTVMTSPVETDRLVTITATYSGVAQNAQLGVTVSMAALSAVGVSPATVLGGASATGTVTLDDPAPVGGAVVSLMSSEPGAAQAPASVTVAAGATTATFPVTTSPVAADTPVTITATYNGVAQSAALAVTAPVAALSAVSVSPATVLGGTSVTGTVTLDCPAPAGGAVVGLTSSVPAAAQAPASVTVAAGATTATFPVTTSPVATNTPVTITATYNGVAQSAVLAVTAPVAALSAVSVSPATVPGGTSVTGTVALDYPAPAGGAVVGLTSSVPAAAQAPASVTVAAGAATATFPVTTSAVAADTPVTITATYSGVTQGALLTVTALVGQVLFSDDFSGPSGSDPLWTTVFGSWTVDNGVMNGTSAANNIGCAVIDRNWTDYCVRGRFMFPAGTFAGGLGGRLNRATGARYGVWIYPTAFRSPTLVLIKFRSWTSWSGTFMARATLPSLGTTWHTLMMTFQGNRIQVSYDDNPLIDVTDNDFDSRAAYLSGGISMDLAEGSSPRILSFDDIVVTVLGPAAALSEASVSPATVLGGASVTGTVTLDNAAPAGGAVVGLTSSVPSAAQVPAGVTAAAGRRRRRSP